MTKISIFQTFFTCVKVSLEVLPIYQVVKARNAACTYGVEFGHEYQQFLYNGHGRANV